MVLTPVAQARIDAQKRLQEQIIYDPEFSIDKIQALPFTHFLRTNNFVQQTAARMHGKNPDIKRWFAINTDSKGRLLLSPESTDGAQIFVKNRNFTDAVVMDAAEVINSSMATHVGIDVSSLTRKTIAVSSTRDVTVRFQVSNDDVNWYTVQNTNDTEFSMNVNNEKVSIELIDTTHFLRIVITNTSGGTATITAVIMGIT